MDSLKLLEFIKRIQAISQAGITYAENGYDIERYEELRQISLEMMNSLTDIPLSKLKEIFTNETGYQTPKVDVRAVIFRDNKVLLVKENLDNCWSLPGGWADVGYSPSEVAIKEVKEEAGLDVKADKILAVFDKKYHPHPPSPYHTYKIFIKCSITGGILSKGMETSDTGFFALNELPELSKERVTLSQITTFFKLQEKEQNETLFD